MRYSIIHHDVRERFSLTMVEYVVADSIHQLSHSGPTTKSNREIARFLGIDEGSVRNSKRKLLEKGLIHDSKLGMNTSELWSEAVTYLRNGSAPVRNKSAEVRNLSESHNIIKESNRGASPKESSREIRVVEEREDPRSWREGTKSILSTPYSAEATRALWDKAPIEYQILAWFFTEKKLWSKADNKMKMQQFMKRHMNAARRIAEAGWAKSDLVEAKDKALFSEQMEEQWTLETIEKYLTK